MHRPMANPPAIVKSADDLQALAEQINQEHRAGENARRRGLGHYRKVGELLLQARAKCKHGEWLPWLNSSTQ